MAVIKPAIAAMAVLTLLLAANVASMVGGANAAAATRVKTVCRDGASLRHAPAGVRVGHVRRGERVIVTQYARRHRWAFAVTTNAHGWLLTSALCRRS